MLLSVFLIEEYVLMLYMNIFQGSLSKTNILQNDQIPFYPKCR